MFRPRNTHSLFVLVLFLSCTAAIAQEELIELPAARDWASAIELVRTGATDDITSSLSIDDGVSWIYLDLRHSNAEVVHFATPLLYSYRIYDLKNPILLAAGGILEESSTQEIFHPEFMISLSPKWGSELLLRIEAEPGVTFPINFYTAEEERQTTLYRLLGDGIYYGAIGLMILFAICIALFNQDTHATRLSIMLTVWFLTMATATGYAGLLFWPGSPLLSIQLYPALVALASLSSSWFSWNFLKRTAKGSVFLKGISLSYWLSALFLISIPFLPIASQLVGYVMIATGLCVICCAVISAVKGDHASKYLIISATLAVMPFGATLFYPELLNLLFLFASFSLLFVVLAVLRRMGDRITHNEIQAEIAANRSQFLATMSHEIRTPLNGIIGFSELCTQEELKGDLKEHIEQINRSSKRLLHIVNDVLDFSKLEADGMQIEYAPTEVRQIVADIMSTLRPIAAKQNVTLKAKVSDEVAEYISTDPHRLSQILLNLCGNAVKFSQDGKMDLLVRQQGGVLNFQVKDSGIGIDPDVLPYLFEPFKQADSSTSRKYGGTGLGLAISKQLAVLLEGSLSASSKPGKGSIFTLAIPYQEEMPKIEKHPEQQHNLAGISVLLAEDNQVNHLLARKILEKSGITVDHAEDGVQALTKAEKEKYDVILMDMQMPELSGFEATVKLREAGCTTPIIALTANNMQSDKKACLEAGMDDFLAKPIVHGRLLEKVGFWSEKRQQALN